MTDNVSFGRWLKRRRKALDLTQEDLARRAGYSVSAIRKVEADELQPSKELAETLATHLDVPPERRDHFVRFARGLATGDPGAPEALGSEAVAIRPPAPPPPHNLPAPLTSFIGRAREIAEVKGFLKKTRLVTLTGAGGCGKTRLALQVAEDIRGDHPDGVWLAELASLTDEALIPAVVLSSLGIRAGLGQPIPETLTDYLRALIDWSYDLLSGAEQALLRRLAVFAGSWTLEAAEGVCGEGDGCNDVLDLLTQVVDKSLVVAEERDGRVRYRLLETTRQYLRAKLREAGEEDEICGKHLDWYLSLTEEGANRQLYQATRLDRLEVEQDNLRAALDWCLTHDVEKGLRLAASIWGVWLVRGYGAEGRYWAEALLARAPAPSVPAARVGYQLALLAWDQGDFTACRSWGEQSLARSRELGDPVGTSWSLVILGHLENSVGDFRRVAELYDEALELFQQLKDKVGASMAVNGQGLIAWRNGDSGLARARFEKAVALAREIDDANGAGWALTNLGILAGDCGDAIRARRLVQEGLASFQKFVDKSGIGVTLGFLGYLAGLTGDVARARDLIRESLLLLREIGHRPRIVRTLFYQGDLHVRNGALVAGVRLIAAATAANPYWRSSYGPYLAARMATARELAQSQLGPDQFDAAWTDGQAMALEQAIAYALEE